MPYIKQDRRFEIDSGYGGPENAGELNYLITSHLLRYVTDKGKSYQTLNDIVGALENCKLEFCRRLVFNYEDKKIQENGDVY